MKKNKITFIKVLILLLLFVFGYSYFTAYRIEKEINTQCKKTEFTTFTFNEAKSFLLNNGYQIEENNQSEYNVFTLTAKKNNEIIYIHDESQVWVKYIFEQGTSSITPFVYNIQYGDSYNVVKKKLGINFLNTLLESALGIFNPNIFTEKNQEIIIGCNDEYEYTYLLKFKENRLHQIVIQNFDVYDK